MYACVCACVCACVYLCLCVYVESGCKQIGLRYIHIRFVNQRLNGFVLDLDNGIRNPLPNPRKRVGFKSRSDPFTGLIKRR